LGGGGGGGGEEERKHGGRSCGRERVEGSEQEGSTHSPPLRWRVGWVGDGEEDVGCEEEQRTTKVKTR